MKKKLPALLLIVGFMLLSIASMEVALRLIYDHELSGSWRVFDDRGLHLNKSNGTAVQNAVGHSALYTFRYPHLRTGPVNNGRFKILVLGDSFTFGWLLNWPETYVGRLETHIQQAFGTSTFEIANAAAGGWGLDSYLAYLEAYGPLVNPDIVLVFLNTGDVGRSINNGLYQLNGGNLIAVKKPVPRLKKVFQELPFYSDLISRSYLLDALRRSYLALRYGKADERTILGPGLHSPETIRSSNIEAEKAVVLSQHILRKVMEWCESRNVSLIVVTTAWHNPPYDSGNASEIFMARAPEFFGSLGTNFFDGSDLLVDRKLSQSPRIHIEGDGHPSKEGARLIAEINWPFIESQLTEFCKAKKCLPGS